MKELIFYFQNLELKKIIYFLYATFNTNIPIADTSHIFRLLFRNNFWMMVLDCKLDLSIGIKLVYNKKLIYYKIGRRNSKNSKSTKNTVWVPSTSRIDFYLQNAPAIFFLSFFQTLRSFTSNHHKCGKKCEQKKLNVK